MTILDLRDDLQHRSEREETFWDYLKRLGASDRDLFFRLARNRPGPGAPIVYPERAGFVTIADVPSDEIADMVGYAPEYHSRERMFQEIIELTHRVGHNFRVYIGRTYVRRHSEHLGPLQRWNQHYDNKKARWARVLARVPRSEIDRDELLAITLVKCWEKYNVLCCNNSVVSPVGRLSDDREQVLYMCLTRRR